MNKNRIFLASASPRRRELLMQSGIRFSVFENNVDENIGSKSAYEKALLLAQKKAQAAFNELNKIYPNNIFTVISADTIVSQNNEIFGKPKDKADAFNMLSRLSGHTHSVYTGVCIISSDRSKLNNDLSFCDETRVEFVDLTKDEINKYIDTNEPFDKAGAYAIQGKGAKFIKSIDGNYHNVVGLPVSHLFDLLNKNMLIQKENPCKAVVFDLDGTIMNTIDSISFCANKVLKELGFHAIDNSKYKLYVGNGAGKLVERMLEHYNLPLNQYYEKAYQRYMELFSEYKDYKAMVYKDLYEVIQELKNRGLKIAVFSNKPHKETYSMITKTFGFDFFDEIRGDIDGKILKPNPFAINEWTKKWNINNNEILYLGDTNTDMQTGNNAGAYTVGVAWGFRSRMELLLSGALDVIDEPMQILNYV